MLSRAPCASSARRSELDAGAAATDLDAEAVTSNYIDGCDESLSHVGVVRVPKGTQFPVNQMRNRAWMRARTTHVFLLDADFWPGAGTYKMIADALHVLTETDLALVVPTSVSALVCNEPFTDMLAIGALLALVALVLMTRDAADLLHLGNLRDLGLVLLVFGLQGTSLTCLRWVEYAALSDDQPKFLMVTGLVAGTWGTLLLLLKRRRPQRGEIATGAGIGVYNMTALIVLLTALTQVPGTIFFPLMGCTVVVLDNLAARFLWREPWAPTTLAGVALALMAVLVVL